jgi:lipoprotein-anchoring transpeptidase ErfK/SrfK
VRALVICCLLAALSASDGPADIAARDPSQAVSLLLRGSAALVAAPDTELPSRCDRLDALSRRIFLGGWRVPGRAEVGISTLTVASGQTLSHIGRQSGIPHDLLIRLNPGLDPRRLAVGTRIAVLDAATIPLRIDIRLSVRRLMIWRGPVLVMACPVGVGAGVTPTPTGSTSIRIRVKHPEWRDPVSGKIHPYGSPGNLLGGYWLGFDPGPDKRFASIGCHGWTGDDPERWLGQGGSRGCLRLTQPDIADLYDLILPGTRVEIAP